MGYTKGIKWTNELIKSEILNVMNALNINRMPTSVEIKQVTNNSKLINAIRRNGGYLYWATALKLKQSECDTRTGLAGELKIKEILENKGYEVSKMSCKHPYDLLINGNVKIDVKLANVYNSPDGWSSYSFNLSKDNPTCDIYVLICNDNKKTLVIPSKFLKQTQVCITDKNSKYNLFIDRWDYVKQYDNFYKNIV